MPDATHLSDFVRQSAQRAPGAIALTHGEQSTTYAELHQAVAGFASGLLALGLQRGERVAIYLEKRVETVVASFGSAAAGTVFVPLNPLLKPEQVAFILQDCGVRLLVTSPERLALLAPVLARCASLRHLVLTGADSSPVTSKRRAAPSLLASLGGLRAAAPSPPARTWTDRRPSASGAGRATYDVGLGALSMPGSLPITHWAELLAAPQRAGHRVIDTDMLAILYTSGSTGQPKGVVLSHRNMVAGAKSVASYLENHAGDTLLAALPLSFDAGFSQLTTAFHAGARVVLLNYLLPRDVLKALEREKVTGLTAVPPLYIQLAALEWPAAINQHLRYFANTGGHMPRATLALLRQRAPAAKPYLMYGLTEAFRSTYLPPEEVDRRPDSIGKAIPNAEIMVLRDDGSECAPDEPGELVHRGALVGLGYWGDAEKTAERYKRLPAHAPGREAGLQLPEYAVYSGDTVRCDGEGFLYFIGRRDEMIKTSGYRVSPSEVEEILYATKLVGECVAFGSEHATLGQAIQVVASAPDGSAVLDTAALQAECRQRMPAYMLPAGIEAMAGPLPRNPNGKIDRKLLAAAWHARHAG